MSDDDGGDREQAKTADGRVLAFDVTGRRDGVPVFLLHGTPGSRLGPKPRHLTLHHAGIRLISYDRPGYGGSAPHPGRSVADAAADIRVIADDLGIERFAVVGRSGGGPHALAAAALLPDRVISTAVLVGLAPADAVHLDWHGGMAEGNVKAYEAVDNDWARHVERIRLRADEVRRNPEALIEDVRRQMSEADRPVLDDVGIRRLLIETYQEAVQQGPYGWIDDLGAFRKPWGFAFGDIRCPVLLWHGEDDTFSPVAHSRWLAERIPGVQIRVQSRTAHFGAVEVLPEVLDWLRR
ncbi:alpha/beta hydrolase [Actinoplanes sp. NPDC023714]|uniref:alpha/beta fold hydrolase n=1 Tax=Actinoplanes sp. NPDC023714 TaxID=3154322 RepID=UPI0033D62F91